DADGPHAGRSTGDSGAALELTGPDGRVGAAEVMPSAVHIVFDQRSPLPLGVLALSNAPCLRGSKRDDVVRPLWHRDQSPIGTVPAPGTFNHDRPGEVDCVTVAGRDLLHPGTVPVTASGRPHIVVADHVDPATAGRVLLPSCPIPVGDAPHGLSGA